jgi:hypothetical protein
MVVRGCAGEPGGELKNRLRPFTMFTWTPGRLYLIAKGSGIVAQSALRPWRGRSDRQAIDKS